MKKYTFLLLIATFLFSFFSVQAATDIKKCYGQSVTLKATQTGNSYQWYKDETAITGATQNEYTAINLDKSAKYECKITTNGTSASTGNILSLGGFEFDNKNEYKRPSVKVTDPIRNEKYYVEYS